MAIEAKRMSCLDTLRVQLNVTVPAFLMGLVVPNRALFRRFVRRGSGGRTMRFLLKLRQKYGDHAWTWFPLRRTLLVVAPATMEAVLTSDANAADPTLKCWALSRFAPDSLVISSGVAWRARRGFNECALDLERPLRHAGAFTSFASAEAARLIDPPRTTLRWSDFQSLARRISHQVILGAGNIDDDLGDQLARMLPWSNFFLRNAWAFHALYKRIGCQLAHARPRASTACLIDKDMWLDGCTAHSTIRVPSQIAFWFFVLKDALELHTARTLALVAAHPDVQTKLRQEIQGRGSLTPQAIDGLRYLECCIVEQLRLWTPVPLLLRRALKPFSLAEGLTVGEGEQIVFPAGFHHRDPHAFGEFADRFAPDAVTGPDYPATYVFSAHRQRCAGRTLILYLLKATLASLLSGSRFELKGPPIDTKRIGYLYDHFGVELRAVADA